ncbi:MAG: hypothetical protein ABI467_26565 [Kofleriaceae bacterium]
MRRMKVVLACAIAVVASCDKLRKQHEPDPEPVGSNEPPKSGHSVTVIKDHAPAVEADSAAGSATATGTASASATGSGDGSAKREHVAGGDGSPAARGDDGRVHGPGGPVYMGRGMTCDAAHDHCLRDGIWFSVNRIEAGKQFRAVPVFEFETKWWTWRGEPADDPVKLYKTHVVDRAQLASGTPVIWFSNETSDAKWPESEYEAVTSSRWEAGVVEAQQSASIVMIAGFGAVPLDTVRVLTETRAP